jgi:hypothetical protein
MSDSRWIWLYAVLSTTQAFLATLSIEERPILSFAAPILNRLIGAGRIVKFSVLHTSTDRALILITANTESTVLVAGFAGVFSNMPELALSADALSELTGLGCYVITGVVGWT